MWFLHSSGRVALASVWLAVLRLLLSGPPPFAAALRHANRRLPPVCQTHTHPAVRAANHVPSRAGRSVDLLQGHGEQPARSTGAISLLSSYMCTGPSHVSPRRGPIYIYWPFCPYAHLYAGADSWLKQPLQHPVTCFLHPIQII